MCQAAPVVLQAYRDDKARFGRGVIAYLGGPGDASHQARKSDHNCGNPGYTPGYAHALDTKVANASVGMDIVRARLRDPRTKYVIFRAVLYYPDGTRRANKGHVDHVHTSFKPGTTFDIRPFYTDGDDTMTPEQMQTIGEWMKDTREEIKDALRDEVRRLAAHDTTTDKSVLGKLSDRLDVIEEKIDRLSGV